MTKKQELIDRLYQLHERALELHDDFANDVADVIEDVLAQINYNENKNKEPEFSHSMAEKGGLKDE